MLSLRNHNILCLYIPKKKTEQFASLGLQRTRDIADSDNSSARRKNHSMFFFTRWKSVCRFSRVRTAGFRIIQSASFLIFFVGVFGQKKCTEKKTQSLSIVITYIAFRWFLGFSKCRPCPGNSRKVPRAKLKKKELLGQRAPIIVVCEKPVIFSFRLNEGELHGRL